MTENPEKATKSFVCRWKPVDNNEMKTFFGLLILSGIIKKPNLNMYWSTKELISTPVFSKVMSRDRVRLIRKFLHFNDNNDPAYDSTAEDRDRLHKIQPFLDLARDRFRNVYQPGRNLSVDESLVLFKGRLKFKQCIKTKCSRFGMKLYEVCTADGITLDLLVYCGKGMFADDDPNSDMPATERISLVLMKPFFDRRHVLYTDNYYTSPSLATYFLGRSTHLCGTIRPNRKFFSKDLVATPVEKSQSIFYKPTKAPNNEMLGCKFRSAKDKAGNKPKIVDMLSTYHQATCVEIGGNDADGNLLQKPSLIRDYNLHMGGVDRVDQQLHNVSPLRKNYKWYKKLAIRIIMQMLLNSQKIYVATTGKKITFLEFLKTIAQEWITTRNIPMNLVDDETVTRLSGRHFLSLMRGNPGARDQRPAKRCRVCYAKNTQTKSGKNPSRTRYVCYKCPSTPGLHPDTCFELYHTLEDYS